MPKKSGRPNSPAEVRTEDGYNARKVRFLREIIPTEPLDFNDIPEMERRFKRYLELCELYDQPIGNMAAYTAIGISKTQAEQWEIRDKNEAKREFIRKVRLICGTMREFYMQDGKVQPVTGIWWQKNFDGLKDVTETIQTKIDLTAPEQTLEAVRQKYIAEHKGEE